MDAARTLNTLSLLHPSAADWPSSLDTLPRAPASLVVRGALPSFKRAVAIVGTRSADPEAEHFACELAAKLASAGVVVVSGGARGIDCAAHEGALQQGGTTVAVLATGLEHPYPPENRALFDRMVAAGGCLLSEVTGEVGGQGGRFIQRNRIIAALAQVTVVVQAPVRSGALSTAAVAKKLRRFVFTLPAAPWDPRGQGNLLLLERGAMLCRSVKDVLPFVGREPAASSDAPLTKEPAPSLFPPVPAPRGSRERPASAGRSAERRARRSEGSGAWPLSDPQASIVRALAGRSRDADELAALTGLSAPELQQHLLELLLEGRLQQRGVGRYALVR